MSTAVVSKPSLTIKRRFNAAPSEVFAAWTQAEKLAQWMGPAGVQSVRAECDLRVGGRYHIKMITADDEHGVSGVYREIVPDEKISFTWAWKSTPERESLVTVTLKPDGGGGTIMTLMHEQFFDEEARNRHQHGWEGSLVKLETYLATQ